MLYVPMGEYLVAGGAPELCRNPFESCTQSFHYTVRDNIGSWQH